MDIAAWLHGLGLQQYERAFRENAIDAAVLRELTAEDLRDIGVNLVGHRRKLLAAISVLRSGVTSDPPASAANVERRQLTVMFCDLVGSTALSVRRDPEDLRDLIGAYHRAVAEVVSRFEGFVARYMGDGVLIYFGYPRAHEDDAERAARCALTVVEAVSGLKLAEELSARVGIATGMVVVGGRAPEHDVVGETPNLAARLQNLAEPNTVLIDGNTRRLTGGLFEYRDLGAVEARGFTGTVSAWEVLRPRGRAAEQRRAAGCAQPARRCRGWCFNTACPRTPRSYSSMRWCRTQPMAPFCAARAGYCTRKSRRRWRPIPPRSGTANPSYSPTTTPRPGS